MKWKVAAECHHCKQWIEAGEEHDCWTTTEAALTQDLSEDLQDAYARLREAAVEFGDQRIYASGSCIMFSRETCYFFVRPKRSFLEVAVFLGRALKAPQVRRADRKSKTKFANILKITHRDQVEAPITDWLQEAYELPDRLAAAALKGCATDDVASKAGSTPARAKSKSTRRPPVAQASRPAREKSKPSRRRAQPRSRPRARQRSR